VQGPRFFRGLCFGTLRPRDERRLSRRRLRHRLREFDSAPGRYGFGVPAVGFRCFKNAIAYVVLDGDVGNPTLVEHHHTRLPTSARAAQLVWVRMEVQEIIERAQPTAIAFKATEPVSRTKDLGRSEVEGVLQEAVGSAGLEPLRRVKSQIKADLTFERPARYLESLLEGDLRVIPANRREAALAALSALAHA
jgi:hypothetical protein